jgi:hypothetical protein
LNRSITNAIRYVMDECIPPLIRDSAWFMAPFYFLAYRGRNVRQAMDFKRLVYEFTEDEYRSFYEGLRPSPWGQRACLMWGVGVATS